MRTVWTPMVLAMALGLVGCVRADSIICKGSDTVLPLTQKEAEVFMGQHAEQSITVVGGGSGVGIAALLDGTTDIATSSREIQPKEKKQARPGKSWPSTSTNSSSSSRRITSVSPTSC